MGLSWLWAWCYQHRQNILKVNGSCEREVEDPGSDPCSGAVIPIRHGLELPSLIHFLIAGITVSLSSVLCISNYFYKEEQLLCWWQIFFPPHRKLGFGMLTWSAVLNSNSSYNLGRKRGLTLSPTPSGGDLTPKLSLLLAYHYYS